MQRRQWVVCISVVVLFLAGRSFGDGLRQTRIPRGRTIGSPSLTAAQKYVPGEVLVKFRPYAAPGARTSAHAVVRGNVQKRFESIPGLELVQLPEGTDVPAAVRQYAANADVAYAEPNFIVRAFGEPNDPYYPRQWSLHNTSQTGGLAGADIKAQEAWNYTTGSRQVVVVTIDTGIDYNHPDLAPNLFQNPTDCNANGVDDDRNGYADDCHGINTAYHTSDPLDDEGHGTHVAGTIGAAGNNALGVVGVNWNVQIMACKFLDNYGSGDIAGAIECLNYVKAMKDRGVNVVATNNSWGGMEFSQALVDAIDAQRQSGILFIAAAGNDFANNDRAPVYPANIYLPNVITVAASTDADTLALFSNVGRHTVHLAAPGQDILSTYLDGQYAYMSGTSMATPHVTGLAALLAAQDPSRSWKEIKNLILAGGDLDVRNWADTITYHRMNALGSVNCTDKPVSTRLRPLYDDSPAAVGSPVTLSSLYINCAFPAASSMQAAVFPGGQTIWLVDDGTGADQSAGDGIFTGQWTPTQPGSYSIQMPTGETIKVEALTAYRPVQQVMSYREITGTNLDMGDDDVRYFDLPFPIQYGDGKFSRIYVSSNGAISFTNQFGDFYNRPLPLAVDPFIAQAWDSTGTTVIAPFWDDLYPVRGSSQNLFSDIIGSAPSRELVIEWRNVGFFDCLHDLSKNVTFQVVFSEASSDVLFHYRKVDSGCGAAYNDHNFGGSATVGLQIAPTVGNTWTYAQKLVTNGTAILWQLVTKPQPDNPVPVLTSLSPNTTPVTQNPFGPGVTITVNGSNFVPGSKVQWDGSWIATTYVSSTQLRAVIPDWNLQWREMDNITVFNPEPGGGTSNALPFGIGFVPPWITSLSPASATAGGAGFTLTINGVGFDTGWVGAYWNQSFRDATYVSPTRVTMQVTAQDIATAGVAKITVYVNAAGNTNTVDFPINVLSRTNSLRPVSNDPNTTPPHLKLPNRFLGWGYAQHAGPDYLKQFSRPYLGPGSTVANAVPPGPIQTGLPSLPFGSALPGLGLRPMLPGGYMPSSVATGDFNGDGKLDWAVTNGGDSTIWIYLGRGDGTSELPRIIPLRGYSPIAISAGDLRGNGKIDLIVAEIDSGTVGVLLGNGDGTFEIETQYYMPAPPVSVVVADFDKDGKLDVVVGTFGTIAQGAIVMLPGDRTGALGPMRTTPSQKSSPAFSASSIWLAAADWNRDGYPDLVVIEMDGTPGESGVFIYLNAGNGTFKLGQLLKYPVPQVDYYLYGADGGDLNGDSCPDVVLVDSYSVAEVFIGNCDGTFQERTELNTGLGAYAYFVKLADVNGDGILDIVAPEIYLDPWFGVFGSNAGNLLSVAFGRGNGAFDRPRVYRGETSAFMLAVGDVNGDGKLDAIAPNQDNDTVAVFVNDGTGRFGPPEGEYVGYVTDGNSGTVNSPHTEPNAVDVNGDGKADIAYLELPQATTPYNITTLLNIGNRHFSAPKRSSLPLANQSMVFDYVFADFLKTGHNDLLVLSAANDGSASFYTLCPGNGDGSFATCQSTSAPDAYWGVVGAGDFSRDGLVDFVIARTADNGLTLIPFMATGPGTFTQRPSITVPVSNLRPYAVYVGDYNKDGRLDVLVWMSMNEVPYVGHDVYEFLGNGDGTFVAPRTVLQDVDQFNVVDVNHDGLLDIVEFRDEVRDYPAFKPPRVRIFLGQSDGSFALKNTYESYSGRPLIVDQSRAVARHPASSRVADYDGDGNPDIAVFQWATRGAGYLTYAQLLKGNGDGNFTPTYDVHMLTGVWAPSMAADLDGDGRAELVELDSYTSSYHVIGAKNASGLQLGFPSAPVLGASGTLRVIMNAPATSDVTVQLQASDPAISIAPSVTIPAGSNGRDVPFQLGSGFNGKEVFSFTATSGAQTATVYGTQALPGSGEGFAVYSGAPYKTVFPGETTGDYMVGVASKGGWYGNVSLRCEDLPDGATCVFGQTQFTVVTGGCLTSELVVRTSSNTPFGMYTIHVVASDGNFESSVGMQLGVGDYGIAIHPTSINTPVNGWSNTLVTISSTNGYMGSITLSCEGLPASITCAIPGVNPNSSVMLSFNAQNAAPGTYPFTVTVSNSLSSRSASGMIKIVDFIAAPEITTTGVTGVTANGAYLHGQVNPNAGWTTAWFAWGTDQYYLPNTTPPVEVGDGANPVDLVAGITDLTKGQQYYFRAMASNSQGYSQGDMLSFVANGYVDPRHRGGMPQRKVSATQLAFAAVRVGSTSASQQVQLTNTGSAALAVISVGVSGPFSQWNNCGASVAAGQSCTITLLFKPVTTRISSGQLLIRDNVDSGSAIVDLSGSVRLPGKSNVSRPRHRLRSGVSRDE